MFCNRQFASQMELRWSEIQFLIFTEISEKYDNFQVFYHCFSVFGATKSGTI